MDEEEEEDTEEEPVEFEVDSRRSRDPVAKPARRDETTRCSSSPASS